jgi:hypothetical protein
MNHVHGMRRISQLRMASLILSIVASHATLAGAQGSLDRRSPWIRTPLIERQGGGGDTLLFSMSPERWSYGSVPSAMGSWVSLLDVPGKHNAELHWYSPHAVVKDSDLDPTLTDDRGAQNSRPVLALSVPRRPVTAAPNDSLWVSLTYKLDPFGLDLRRSVIDFWVNDWRDASLVRGPGVMLHVDVGVVSEDQMRAPDQRPNGRLDTEDQSPFDGQLVATEDTGVDGTDNSANDGLSAPLDLVTANENDRAGDDYGAPTGDYAEIDPRRWIRTNGTEGNRFVSPHPDLEDLNLDNVLEFRVNYVEYTIDLGDTSRRYLVTDVHAEFAGKTVPHPPGPDNGWRRYQIPVDDTVGVQFGLPDLIQVRQVRIWVDGILSPDGPEDAVSHQKRPLLMLASNARTPEARETSGVGSPNPFVSSTTFAYGLDAPARVRAVVLDLQGREVTVIEEGDRGGGYHSFVWDGRHSDGSLAHPGLYFVRARIEGHPDRLWRVIRMR